MSGWTLRAWRTCVKKPRGGPYPDAADQGWRLWRWGVPQLDTLAAGSDITPSLKVSDKLCRMDTRPDYQRIYDALFARLAEREWEIGEKLPSIKHLQDEYEVPSLNTVRRAQQMLVEEGYLRTEQGRGAFVIAHPSRPAERERIADALALIDSAMHQLTRARRLLSPAAGA
jgi:DNA-binding transcriptional regulator YhcF (GntR family)